MTDLDGYFGELGQEMRGIASTAGIDLGIVVGLNVAYELRRVSVRILVCDVIVFQYSWVEVIHI